MSKAGQPTKYNPDVHPKVAKVLCELGATMQVLADAFGVSLRTIYTYRLEYPEFLQSIERGMVAITNGKVQTSLYRLATGDPPSFRACRFWLMNRRPKEWGYRQAINVKGDSEERL